MSTVCCCADSMQIPPSPLSVANGDLEQVAQKQGSLDVNGFPRITGLSTEQHTFTADIAFSQVPAAFDTCQSDGIMLCNPFSADNHLSCTGLSTEHNPPFLQRPPSCFPDDATRSTGWEPPLDST